MDRIANSDVHLPPGFRFHPTDEELIIHYLRKRVTSSPLPASIMAEVDLYMYNPWELPNKALFGEDEWYFFTPRNRKYPNGARPNRAAASGYWKATGTDKPIMTSCGTKSIGVKKALVFYTGRPLKGIKTDWIMHEYRLLETMIWSSKQKGSMRLDDWVLCRVRQKSNNRSEPSYDHPAGFLPNENHPRSTNMNPDNEMVREYISYDDYPMLPYILASQNLPSIETDSSISFIRSNKSCSSIYEGNSNKKTLQFSDSSGLESFLDQLNRKTGGESERGTFLMSDHKKLCSKSGENEDVIISTSTDENGMNFHETDQSEGNNYSTDQWISMVQSHSIIPGSD